MKNFTEIEEGNLKAIHNSTSSTIEIVMWDKENDTAPSSIWLDYYDWANLVKIVNEVEK